MKDIDRVMAIARVNKKDEFYTQMKTIENELENYKSQLKNKTIYFDILPAHFVNENS
jgi:GTPase involved in cell partitioning and DNA repair